MGPVGIRYMGYLHSTSIGYDRDVTNESIAKRVKRITRLQKSNWMAEDHNSCMSLDQETYVQILKSVGINKITTVI